eukprot:CAMPEP_0198135592 /NCGR_PEP_ID=MMETSP1442-20131203/60668_1 /TAXON_ID= /ORGANISM="Craspedostauros australis, Strain CCMP3328" /LENGTH=143 /DNA_ID=CAMNT_0043796765 /DNA_START=42 /DNA_END=473 /DNA_ORIENTATION=-
MILWGTEKWRALKTFREVHDLPVTCCAARPFSLPLQGDDGDIQVHAMTASADSKLAWLSMSRASRRRSKPATSSEGGMTFQSFFNSMLRFALLMWILWPVVEEMRDKCEETWGVDGYMEALHCVRYKVLFAADSTPGIRVPPH